MDRKKDLRIIKTERNLKEALFCLLEKKPANKITVKELTGKAEVSRATFYLYYDSIPDMIASIEADILTDYEEQIHAIAVKCSNLKDFILRTVRFNFEITECYLTFSRLLYTGSIGENHIGACIGIIIREVKRLLTDPADAADYHYFLLFELNGAISIIRKWVLEDADRLSVQEMSELMSDIILNNTRKYWEFADRMKCRSC